MRKLLFILIALLTIESCQKNQPEISQQNDADKFISERGESPIMTEQEVDLFLEYCQIWPKDILMEMVCRTPSNSPAQRFARLIDAAPSIRVNNEPVVESIIQQTPRKRIIDANAILVAQTIANMGLSTSGQLIGIDYHKSSTNTINNTDVFLAGWAYGTTFQNGSQFAAFDTYIEFQDLEPTYTAEFSGGNYTIEGVITYNGPSTPFSFYNVQTAQTEERTVETGEIFVYGPDSEFGDLFFNLTLVDETLGADTFNTATINGPIPGTVSGAQAPIALSGGPWPVVTQ